MCKRQGYGIDGSVELLLLVQSPLVRAMGGRAAPPTANAGLYTTSNCKPLPFMFPYKG